MTRVSPPLIRNRTHADSRVAVVCRVLRLLTYCAGLGGMPPAWGAPASQPAKTELSDFGKACRTGTAEQVIAAIRGGAAVNAKEADGSTPLVLAASYNKPADGRAPTAVRFNAMKALIDLRAVTASDAVGARSPTTWETIKGPRRLVHPRRDGFARVRRGVRRQFMRLVAPRVARLGKRLDDPDQFVREMKSIVITTPSRGGACRSFSSLPRRGEE